MEESLEITMICRHSSKQKLFKYDNTVLYQCSRCQLIFSDKYKKNFNPKTLYKNYYKNALIGRFKFGVEYIIKLFRFFRAFKIYTLFPRATSVLDIGCGRGFMLYFLKKFYKYRKTIGTQFDRKALEFSRNKLGLEIYDKDLLEMSLGSRHFDIITMWHVLEHIHRPEKYIGKISKLLKDTGELIIEVPNFNSWTRPITGKYWLGLDLKYHFNFFTPRSLSILLRKYNFEIKRLHTFSLEYSTFISTQSIISLITKSDHLFFLWIQTDEPGRLIIFHVFLFILLAPVCFLVNILLYFSKKGEVLLVIAKKKKIPL